MRRYYIDFVPIELTAKPVRGIGDCVVPRGSNRGERNAQRRQQIRRHRVRNAWAHIGGKVQVARQTPPRDNLPTDKDHAQARQGGNRLPLVPAASWTPDRLTLSAPMELTQSMHRLR